MSESDRQAIAAAIDLFGLITLGIFLVHHTWKIPTDQAHLWWAVFLWVWIQATLTRLCLREDKQ